MRFNSKKIDKKQGLQDLAGKQVMESGLTAEEEIDFWRGIAVMEKEDLIPVLYQSICELRQAEQAEYLLFNSLEKAFNADEPDNEKIVSLKMSFNIWADARGLGGI